MKQIRIDDTLHVFDAASEARIVRLAQKALANGATVVWADGTTEWETVSPVIAPGQSGSAMYTWDAHGNKVKHRVTRYTQSTSGTTRATPLGFTWRKP